MNWSSSSRIIEGLRQLQTQRNRSTWTCNLLRRRPVTTKLNKIIPQAGAFISTKNGVTSLFAVNTKGPRSYGRSSVSGFVVFFSSNVIVNSLRASLRLYDVDRLRTCQQNHQLSSSLTRNFASESPSRLRKLCTGAATGKCVDMSYEDIQPSSLDYFMIHNIVSRSLAALRSYFSLAS